MLPTKPRTPRHKGKVERGVDSVQQNALKGRTFPSLDAQNQHFQEWESRTADTRIHGTTKKQVLASFNEAERTALLPQPSIRFDNFREAMRKVSRDGHVEVAKAFYSMPGASKAIGWRRASSRSPGSTPARSSNEHAK